MILCFELTMPNRGSWNGQWSGEKDLHLKFVTGTGKEGITKLKELDGKSWFYRWSDGWTACIEAKIVTPKDSAKLRKKNGGFCGYDWMVESIMRYGEIRPQRDWTD